MVNGHSGEIKMNKMQSRMLIEMVARMTAEERQTFIDEMDKRFPNLVDDWAKSKNKRRRFRFKAETLSDPTIPLGGTGHNYLPTNNPTFAPHFDHTATAITIDPSTNAAIAYVITVNYQVIIGKSSELYHVRS